MSQSTISKLENGKPFDLLEIGFYMKIYEIGSENVFMKLHANGALSEEELAMQKALVDEYPLFGSATASVPAVVQSIYDAHQRNAQHVLGLQDERRKIAQ